jgi:hypothetical protein
MAKMVTKVDDLDLTEAISFQDMVDMYPIGDKVIDQLPICHTTNWGSYNKINRKKKISCEKLCDVYKEKLVYFFYGKASYADKENNVPSITNEDPITLIFDLKEISSKPYRIMPFDSGGFSRYEFKKDFDKEDFAYEQPGEGILNKLVQILHETNMGYLQKKLSKEILEEYKEVCRPLRELTAFYESVPYGKKDYGDRAFTFEVQFKDQDIEYLPKIIILPFTYYNEKTWPKMKQAYNEKGILLEYYNDNESYVNGTDSYTNMKVKVLNLLNEYYQN